MTRFTSIGMPKKTFVASAAEEAKGNAETGAGPSDPATAGEPPAKKRKRRGTRGKTDEEIAASRSKEEAKKARSQQRQQGWGRDPSVANRARLSAQHADERRQKRFDQRDSNTTCFACRSVGHAARDCPNVLLALEKGGEGSASLLGDGETPKTEYRGMKRKLGKKGGDLVGNKCYRCNGTDHSLGNCPEPVDPTNPTPFATCYICIGTGHLSSLCPQNPGRGIYVNGGSCKVCGSTAHRAKDCPEEAKMKAEEAKLRPRRGEIVLGGGGRQLGADEDDFMVESRDRLHSGEGKGKMKKKAPNNNGPRAPYASFNSKGEDAEVPIAPVETDEAPRPLASSQKPKSKPKVIAF